jgi:uncharacterized membrane protein YcaP (DUF421 family)
MNLLEMVIRAVLVFIVLYIWCRILGKKLISQMTFFDFVAGIALGSISGSIMYSQNIPLAIALVGLSVFALMAFILDVTGLRSFKSRKVINGEPTLIVKNGEILENGMGKARLTMDNLLMLLRKKNIFYVDDVELAFLETDGTVSALKKPETMPATRQDLQVVTTSRGLPQTFIIDGKILENSLKAAGKDQQWVKSILDENDIPDVKNVAFAQIDQQNKVFVDKRKDAFQ